MKKFDRIVATELKNGKYRFEAVETDGTKHVIRKAGNLTKGILQWESDHHNISYHFSWNVAESHHPKAVKVFTPNNGIDVIDYESK